jgi:hypothetical protein
LLELAVVEVDAAAGEALVDLHVAKLHLGELRAALGAAHPVGLALLFAVDVGERRVSLLGVAALALHVDAGLVLVLGLVGSATHHALHPPALRGVLTGCSDYWCLRLLVLALDRQQLAGLLVGRRLRGRLGAAVVLAEVGVGARVAGVDGVQLLVEGERLGVAPEQLRRAAAPATASRLLPPASAPGGTR